MTKQYLMPASRITTGTAVPTSAGTAGDLYVRNTDPYPSGYIRIGTPAELVAFAARVNAGETSLNACLTADIDMTGVSNPMINNYSGNFNGFGHTISNVTISAASSQCSGLFAHVSGGGSINKVNCSGFNVSGLQYTGSLVGQLENSTINMCSAIGCTVSGGDGSVRWHYAGGLIGIIDHSSVYDSYASGCSITNLGEDTGGLAALIYGAGTISNCYAYDCTVSNTYYSAGFIGYSTGATAITNCATYGGSHGGTLIKFVNGGASPTNCYTSSSTGVTQAVFQTQGFWDGSGVSGTTYLSWDFDDIWEWDSTTSLPKLQAVAVSIDTLLYAYNGSSWALQNTVLDATPTSASANGVTSGGVYTALSGKQETAVVSTGTLTVAGWSSKTQTISVSGVTASNTVIVSPSSASFSDYGDAKIYCSAQGTGTLTFTCDTVPASAVTVNVVIL